jgi:deoxyhypusine synthase
MIDVINEIINKKWKELEAQESIEETMNNAEEEGIERLAELVVNLEAINDFEREFSHYLEKIEEKEDELTEEQIDALFFGLYEKWTFIFCAILNLDISNPYILTYMHQALMSLMEEYGEDLEE